MKSKVHPTYKTKYRVANWPAYNQALVRRGDVTVWVSSAAAPRRSGRRGSYSDLAIETALTLRLLSHLPLRQAEGFLHALFEMMRLDLCVGAICGWGGDAGADQVAGGDAAAIVEEAGRHPGRLTRGAPRAPREADGWSRDNRPIIDQ